MIIFDILKDIIEDKKNILINDAEQEKEFSPFLVQRWLSFYSPKFTQLVNHSSNCFWSVMEDKGMWYTLFLGTIPKIKYHNIRYIKKNKDSSKKIKGLEKESITYLAQRLELSEREINKYIEESGIDLKLLKKQIQSD